MTDYDSAALRLMEAEGWDLDQPMEVDQHFYELPSDAAATGLAEELRREGFQVRIEQFEDDWTVVAAHRAVIDPVLLDTLNDRFEGLAKRFGGVYDGWSAGPPLDESR